MSGRGQQAVGRPTNGSAGHLVVLLAAALVLLLPLSGCALAGRLLGTASAASVRDALDTDPERAVPATTGARVIHAVVNGTRGSGLRLNRDPGAGRIAVLPDGTVVTVLCHAVGRPVTGPYGSTSTWSYVTAPDGRNGYMSDAYLVLDADPAAVPRC